ncbi:glycosyltransferase family 2 protein [Congregibacter litoralis]|uniref:Putative glycosyltransferase n=1 Tax=Congregibacter litoralis KT71 TaxID=314285 RepID=A4A567_9GAMM|nr:glycosyltransferase family A protein [Congregibacter litoralis]EAQ98938.2 putative glycosyltransferase [Congregibacter litoralis KT71]
MSDYHVSFVVPHKGREAFLQKTLASVAAQTSSVAKDVVVITQNKTLLPQTTAYAGELDLRIIYAAPELTISALRNQGVAAVTSTHLAFLDADIALSPNWLEQLLPMLEGREDIALISAMQVNDERAPPLERIRTALSNASVDSSVDFLPGRNLLLRRTIYEAVGGFPEHLMTCEDYYFTDKVSEHGRLWYSGQASYIHLGEDKALGEMFSKEIWRGQSNLQSMAGRHIRINEWPSFFIPPWITLLTLTAVAMLLTAQWALALCAFLLALLPFSAYVTRLYVLADRRIALGHIAAFYGYYFPARTWGTILGVFKTMGNNLHDH